MESKILIVEDEKKIADTLRFGLNELGFQVEVAYDGTLGYRLFCARELVIPHKPSLFANADERTNRIERQHEQKDENKRQHIRRNRVPQVHL